jgi:RNA recognition motif-containing protein
MSVKADLPKVYVENLGSTPPNEEDLEKVFGNYGKVAHVWLATSSPSFAYITYENEEDARNACAGLNGKHEFGQQIKVEMEKCIYSKYYTNEGKMNLSGIGRFDKRSLKPCQTVEKNTKPVPGTTQHNTIV